MQDLVAGAVSPDLSEPVGVTETTIYRSLRDAIEDGNYEPGDRLPAERELSGRLGAPRGAVRRAIQRLEREGRVTRQIGAGTFVAPLREDRADAGQLDQVSPLDVLEARMALEPGFADLVVARASADDLGHLQVRVDVMRKAGSQDDFREAGYAFHLALARATRNPLLVHFFEIIIAARVAAGMSKLRHLNDTQERRDAQVARNQAVVDALAVRDAQTSRRLLRRHLSEMVTAVVAGPD